MAEASLIEWTDATWNPVTGCTLVSEGCRHCYAARLAATRLRDHPSRAGLARINAAGEAKFTGEVRFNEDWLDQPLRWRRPRRIFVCAHGDLFHESVPDDWIDRVFAVMALAPQHVFQVLTKRPERMRRYIQRQDERGRWPAMDLAAIMAATGAWNTPALDLRKGWPLPNVWLGVSVEDQPTADARIPDLLATPAALRFVSAEPLLGPVNLRRIRIAPDHHTMIDALDGYAITDCPGSRERAMLDWVIAGGESGPGARPMHPDWARRLRDQCATARVPFFFKQWGEWVGADVQPQSAPESPENTMPFPDRPRKWWRGDPVWGGLASFAVGKRAAGWRLDGREHREFPR